MLRLSRSAVAITLSAIALSLHAPLVAGAPVPPPSPRAHDHARRRGRREGSEGDGSETKHKGDDPKQDKNDDSDDENGWADCLGSCIGGMFSSSSSSSPKTLTASSAPIAMEWRVGSLRMILPADTLARDVELWDGPAARGPDTRAPAACASAARWSWPRCTRSARGLGSRSRLPSRAEPRAGSPWTTCRARAHGRSRGRRRARRHEASRAAVGSAEVDHPAERHRLRVWSAGSDGQYEFGGFMASLTHLWRFGAFASGRAPTTASRTERPISISRRRAASTFRPARSCRSSTSAGGSGSTCGSARARWCSTGGSARPSRW